MATTQRQRAQRQERRRAGSSKRDSYRSASRYLRIPPGMKSFRVKDRTYRFDLVPYKVGKGNPCADEGFWYYERTFFTHKNVGPDNDSVICPASTFKKPCPICEFRDARIKLLRDQGQDPFQDETVKNLRTSERQLFLVHDHDEPAELIQLWDYSNYGFGELLDAMRAEGQRDNQPHKAEFDDDAAGSWLRVSFKAQSGRGAFYKAFSIEFNPRPDGLDESLLEHGYCLDDMLIELDYNQLRRLYFGEGPQQEDMPAPAVTPQEPPREPQTYVERPCPTPLPPQAPPMQTSPPAPPPPAPTELKRAQDVGMTVGQYWVHPEYGEVEIIKISPDGTSIAVEDDNGDFHKAVGVEELSPLPGRASLAAEQAPSQPTAPPPVAPAPAPVPTAPPAPTAPSAAPAASDPDIDELLAQFENPDT